MRSATQMGFPLWRLVSIVNTPPGPTTMWSIPVDAQEFVTARREGGPWTRLPDLMTTRGSTSAPFKVMPRWEHGERDR